MDQEKPIEWEPLPGQSFNPEFSGYTAAPYFTDHPELGFCLYSRDGQGTWNQRTKRILPPDGWKAHPVFVNGKWWWSYEFPKSDKCPVAKQDFEDLDYGKHYPPIELRGDESNTDVTHTWDGLELATDRVGAADSVRIRVDKTTHQIRTPKDQETEHETIIFIEPLQKGTTE